MIFLLDMRKENGRHADLKAKIVQAAGPDRCEVHGSVADLHARLCRHLDRASVVVFRPATANDLHEFLCISDLPADIQVILILPDQQLKTVSLGHSLRPRYISYDQLEFDDVASVVRKIGKRLKMAD